MKLIVSLARAVYGYDGCYLNTRANSYSVVFTRTRSHITRTQNVLRGHYGKCDCLFRFLVFCAIVTIMALTQARRSAKIHLGKTSFYKSCRGENILFVLNYTILTAKCILSPVINGYCFRFFCLCLSVCLSVRDAF